jgi:cell division GTPase FtsZ
MTVLILSLGGGGGNILRSLKALFRRDLATIQESDPRYAERLRRAVVTRFLDTNEFSLADVPVEERLIIGPQTTRHLGSRHDPDVARRALEESKAEVEALLAPHTVVILIGTGGKGTGAGTIVPIAKMARQQRKLVIPIFARPSFEWHEVEKRRYDHALTISEQFDEAGIRFIEILNDRGYSSANPQPQHAVWERMNRPIARGLRGLLYVLSDLSQVDPSDLSMLFAGPGRLRIGFAEIDPPTDEDPTDQQVNQAVGICWDNPYSLFSKPVGTSLICIQGQWSNVVDGHLKGGLAALATAGGTNSTYNPLHAFTPAAPKPWGVTALFAEYTGSHSPLDIEWPEVRSGRPLWFSTAAAEKPARIGMAADAGVPQIPIAAADVGRATQIVDAAQQRSQGQQGQRPQGPAQTAAQVGSETSSRPRSFFTFWEFALALNRNDPSALAVAADGTTCDMAIEASQIRKLLGTVWFRSVFQCLSSAWRVRLLNVLLDDTRVRNHVVRDGRRAVHLNQLSYEQLKRAAGNPSVPDVVRPDLQLLVAIATLWGSEALTRVTYEPVKEAPRSSRFDLLLPPFRHL